MCATSFAVAPHRWVFQTSEEIRFMEEETGWGRWGCGVTGEAGRLCTVIRRKCHTARDWMVKQPEGQRPQKHTAWLTARSRFMSLRCLGPKPPLEFFITTFNCSCSICSGDVGELWKVIRVQFFDTFLLFVQTLSVEWGDGGRRAGGRLVPLSVLNLTQRDVLWKSAAQMGLVNIAFFNNPTCLYGNEPY